MMTGGSSLQQKALSWAPVLAPWALMAGEILLCSAIIYKIPYTEIDWTAYMQQIAQIKSGVRDYSQIKGQTGWLVYPGGHVVIFEWLYDHFYQVEQAQYVYMALYLVTLGGVLLVYKNAKVPWYYLPLLALSKRLHSIYLLRLFNDCWSVLFCVYGTLALQSQLHLVACVLFSVAISIKMSAALFVPGLAIVWYKLFGLKMLAFGPVGAVPQLAAAWPFLEYPRQYLKGGFNLGRQFMYKWTVNWRFIPQQTFNSRKFANSLLSAHLALLGVLASASKNVRLDAKSITKILALSNLIGIMCARSLHYQFYSWFYWTVPFLLVEVPLVLKPLWLLLEMAWLTYPSTDFSSASHLGCCAVLLYYNLASL